MKRNEEFTTRVVAFFTLTLFTVAAVLLWQVVSEVARSPVGKGLWELFKAFMVGVFTPASPR